MVRFMMTVTVRSSLIYSGLCSRQDGVALLQVLLLSALLSLMAIRFSESARDQLEMSRNVEGRVQAQMAAHSTFNQVIFSILSDSIDINSSDRTKALLALPSDSLLNRYGDPVEWADGITVKIQDLNGLLPQLFPGHILWRALLEAQSLPKGKIDRYLGVLADIQDPDINSWDYGDKEPQKLPNGALYLNGYVQNSKIVEWVFSDNPKLARQIASLSDVDAS
jgi:general secretion pathway protein K